jgi:hypothetical protein
VRESEERDIHNSRNHVVANLVSIVTKNEKGNKSSEDANKQFAQKR